jgi:hypothetical protein
MEQDKKEKIIRKYLEDCYGEFVDNYDTTDVAEHFTYGLETAQKEIKRKLKDKYNHLNSKLKEVNTFKLDKTVNQEARIRLESQVELLKKLIEDVDKQ